MPMRRADYIRALKNERAAITSRPGDHKVRVAAIDAELDRFGERPKQSRRRGAGPQGAETAGGVPVIDERGVIAEQSGAPVESPGDDFEPGV